jgi:3-hydroxyisobutyrate dehydrogenase-like beta-hydroxyacid dehydrogenase
MIGLGLLGSSLAQRLLDHDYPVLGYDVEAERRREHEARGGAVAESPPAVAEQCSTILLSLPNSAISRQVVSAMATSLQPGTRVIDTTTGAPEDAVSIAASLAGRDVVYLDATVAGSSDQARRGDILLLVGGDELSFQACEELFAQLARQIFYCGPAGSGAKMKLVVNLVLGLNRAVLAEGLAFARCTGIDPARALEVLKAGPTYSKVMDTKGAKMVSGEFTLEARLAQHLKDVQLILASGEVSDAKLPFSTLHARLLTDLAERGLGAADNSAIIRAFD